MLKRYCISAVFLLISSGIKAQCRTYPRFMIDSATKQRMRSSVFDAAMSDTSIQQRDIEVTGQPAIGDKVQMVVAPYLYSTKKTLPGAYIMIRTTRDKRIKASSALRGGQAVFILENADFPVQIVARYWKSQTIPVTLTTPKNYQVHLYFEPIKNNGRIMYFGNDSREALNL